MRVPRPLTKASITNNQPSTQTKQALKIIKHTKTKAGESAEVLNAADYFELDAGVDAVANVQAGNDADVDADITVALFDLDAHARTNQRSV